VFCTTDTIVAIATPAGHGGIGVVRVSGPDAPTIAVQVTGRTRSFLPREATLASVRSASPSVSAIDQVIVTWFQAPASYTGEDVVEFAAHGSPVVLKAIVERIVREGARLAEPGEFTFRAYLSGRIDLVQAEAVADLIEAVTPLQARAAMDQLQGTLTSRIASIDSALFDLAARLEASLDFPDEGFHFITRNVAQAALGAISEALDRLVSDGRRGRMIREGAVVAIAGRPNVGKSSLFNALVGADRAIVTDLPGTTRDVLTERVDLEGLAVTLVDTAGLRDGGDIVEVEGIRRAREAHGVARILLVVVDRSSPLTSGDRALIESARDPVVVVSKCDLPAAWDLEALRTPSEPVVLSAHSGAGVEELRRRIVSAMTDGESFDEPPAISNMRHLSLVDEARTAVRRATDAFASGATEELVLAELASARVALEAVVGHRTPDDLLRHIFERFCVGK
jgi:tRNA modification GTPase